MRKTGSSERPDLPLAVVIGAGGLGMAIARRLGTRNRLLLVDRDAGRIEGACAALAAEGHDASGFACDITDASAVAALAADVAARGPLRVLAHVAALSPSMADWQTILRVNLIGATLVERALLARAGRGTAAIFVSSIAAHGIAPNAEVTALLDDPLAPGFQAALDARIGAEASPSLAYRLSKFAMNRMCRRRAAEWGRIGARIVSISPGLIATPMGALEFQGSPQKYELLDRIALQREGTMLEVADAVEFLASDRASFITGTDLLIDGGLVAAMQHPS